MRLLRRSGGFSEMVECLADIRCSKYKVTHASSRGQTQYHNWNSPSPLQLQHSHSVVHVLSLSQELEGGAKQQARRKDWIMGLLRNCKR
jgi:hypothetical protein